MTTASFGIVDLGPITNQARDADDAERAGEAGADDQHDDGADDRQNDLRLDDRWLAWRRSLAPRPQRQGCPQQRRQRQTNHGIVDLVQRMRRMVVGIPPRRRRLGAQLRRFLRRLRPETGWKAGANENHRYEDDPRGAVRTKHSNQPFKARPSAIFCFRRLMKRSASDFGYPPARKASSS